MDFLAQALHRWWVGGENQNALRVYAALALVLAGCATNMRWVKPGATSADFDQDKVRCQYEAQLATANLPTGYGISGAISSGVEQGLRQAELLKLCMQTKGWSLQQVANP